MWDFMVVIICPVIYYNKVTSILADPVKNLIASFHFSILDDEFNYIRPSHDGVSIIKIGGH